MKETILKERHYRKWGYVLRTEMVEMDECPTITIQSAYTPDGRYIGNGKSAYFLCKTKGIKPELSPQTEKHCESPKPACSIGFCEKDKKWYGWSHRAIFGFGVGDTVEEGDCTASSGWTDEWLAEHPEDDLRLSVGFIAQTLNDAKRMAIAFASSVG